MTSIFARLVLTCVVALLFQGGFASAAPDQRSPNIIFIYADDLGYGDLSCHGNPYAQTPHIDRLAAQSVVFTNGYAPASQCSPSRAAIMAGQWPARLHITDYLRDPKNKSFFPEYQGWSLPRQSTEVSPSVVTVAERLRDAGYATFHLGKWHIGEAPSDPLGQGFDEAIGTWPWSWPKSWFSPYGFDSLKDGPKGEYLTDRLTDEAIRIMRQHQDRPFFINFWHYAVHKPLAAPEADVKPFVDAGLKLGEQYPSAQYEAMKVTLDRSVGRVLAALDELGLAENTVVVFTSDNGGVPAIARNAPFRGGKKMFYEGGIRVPFFVRWPGHFQPAQNPVPVVGMDLYSTFVELATGASKPMAGVDGASLMPLLTVGEGWKERALYWHFPQMNLEGKFTVAPQGIVREGQYKLIAYYTDPSRTELFDLEADPQETRNLAAEQPEIVKRLVGLLGVHLAETAAQMPSKG